jgi:hypothetical protein
LSRCSGSNRFGIEAHEADAGDFPVQPSQKDGLGRMCKPHWTAYTSALRKAAVARRTAAREALVVEDSNAAAGVESAVDDPGTPPARRSRRAKAVPEPEAELAEIAAA